MAVMMSFSFSPALAAQEEESTLLTRAPWLRPYWEATDSGTVVTVMPM